MEKRYVALRTIATIYKVLGIISGIIAVLTALGFCAASILGGSAMESLGDSSGMGFLGGVVGGFIVAVVMLIYGGGAAVTLYAIGEGLYLLIALEENTRATALLLKQQH